MDARARPRSFPSRRPGAVIRGFRLPRKSRRKPWVSRARGRPWIASRKTAVAGTISPPTAIGETKTTPSGVKYETLKEGDGPELKPGQTVLVHYTGKLTDGKVFDTSHGDKDEPRSFEIKVVREG